MIGNSQWEGAETFSSPQQSLPTLSVGVLSSLDSLLSCFLDFLNFQLRQAEEAPRATATAGGDPPGRLPRANGGLVFTPLSLGGGGHS